MTKQNLKMVHLLGKCCMFLLLRLETEELLEQLTFQWNTNSKQFKEQVKQKRWKRFRLDLKCENQVERLRPHL